MALHLVQFLLPCDQLDRLEEVLEGHELVDRWNNDGIEEDRTSVQLLVQRGGLESLLDAIQDAFGHLRKFRLITSSINLTIPKVEKKNEKPKTTYGWKRLSRQELQSQASSGTQADRTFVTMVVLSVVVAVFGLVNNNVAVVIAAMVIAPLLGPNIALALATTTGDSELLRRSLLVNGIGVGIALAMAMAISPFIPLASMLEQGEIVSRTEPGWADIPLALAAGAAGALSFTTGVSGSLVGVMVAVALMPPLLVFGLLLFHDPGRASGAIALLAANLICVNLSGIVTFMLQGVRPSRWWEANRARKTTRIALTIWILLLLPVLGLLLFYFEKSSR